eukprot:4653159-Pyramimonas_sp.AAC.1
MLGLEWEARDLKVLAPAAMLRAAIRSEAFDRMRQWLVEIHEDDDHCIAPLVRCPVEKSIIASMKRIYDRYHPSPEFPRDVRSTEQDCT